MKRLQFFTFVFVSVMVVSVLQDMVSQAALKEK